MSYKLWSSDSPTFLKEVLPLFRRRRAFTNSTLTEATRMIGLTSSFTRIKNLTKFWFTIGILGRVKQVDRSFLYELDEFGDTILNLLDFSPSIAVDLMHWTLYTAWLRKNDPEWGWSWVYQEVCNNIWDSSPSQLVVKELLASSVEKANIIFTIEEPSFDIQSIGTVAAWLAALEPPMLRKSDENNPNSPLSSMQRDICSPELFYLGIQLQYSIRDLTFGTPLLIDETIIEDVSKVCLLDPKQFWPMAEICALTFSKLTRKETAYGTSLLISEPAEFTPPTPRALQYKTS